MSVHPSWCWASRYFSRRLNHYCRIRHAASSLSLEDGSICCPAHSFVVYLMKLSVHKLDHCFPTRVPQNMVNMFRQKPWNKHIKFWKIANISKHPATHRRNFFLQIPIFESSPRTTSCLFVLFGQFVFQFILSCIVSVFASYVCRAASPVATLRVFIRNGSSGYKKLF